MRTFLSRGICGTFFAGASLVALSAPAMAQTVVPPADSQSPDQTDPANQAGDESGDIVVVAQGRAQLLSDVPVAVSAVSAETLQNSGANDIRQLNQLAPSLLVSSTGSEANGSARIRGIGTVGDNPGLESSVAVFIDGVYRSRSGIGLNELGEIERVEVLRGPQGTLGGRNASAGMISIISRKPTFNPDGEGMLELTYGNYDNIRVMGAVSGPLTDTIALRFDGVWNRRDGFYYDPANDIDVNNRNRYFMRGQLLWEPNDALSVRIIGDYTNRDERCCGATYVDGTVNPFVGNLNNPASPLLAGGVPNPNGNNIVNVLRDLGQPLAAFNPRYDRTIYSSPGRSFAGTTEDKGVSGQIDYDFGSVKLTSITAYRDYRSGQGSDTDYSSVDILFRTPADDVYREFRTFTQELRLQGTAFDDKLDWLVGGYFANEDLTVRDNLRFGNQYGRFATCRVVSGSALAQFYSPTSAGCLAPAGRAVLSGLVPGVPSPFGAAGPLLVGAFDRLDSINNRGTTRDNYEQNSRNFALFTHNIIRLTDQFDITLGLRYTDERKRFNATFGNDNTACVAQQAALGPLLTGPLAATAGALIGLACQGNSTSELNGVSINSERNENQLTGTAIAAYRPTDDLMLYASYSRGYKAGGFNLDRSALKLPIQTFASLGGAQAVVNNLQFEPELVNAFEIGAKYATREFSLSVAAFRQDFSNFQLNTFNGTVFLVQSINGCSTDLGGADRDQNSFPTGPGYSANAEATGTCAADNVTWGVRSEGVELEASFNPARDVRIGAGLTYANTRYRDNLVGSSQGAPLDPALRVLPGNRMSNAPEWVATASFAYTPELGNSGLSGLLYIDGRMTGDYNTGSDQLPQKAQDGYAIVNARIGLRGADERWAVELWAQNLFDVDYAQVAFNSPFQAGASTAPFVDPQYPGGRQLFSQYLAEPRTYGVTVRTRF